MRLSVKNIITVGVATLATSLPACATSYSAKPITAKVVDAETGEPLEGVNVVVHWIMEEPRGAKGQGHLELMETVTDRNGEYRFPGWGPKAIPSNMHPGTRLTNQDPEIILFKSGYKWNAIYNDSHSTMLRTPDDLGPPIRDSQWNGKTIKLEKFKGGVKQYGGLISGVLTGVRYGECQWKKIPKIIVALTTEKERLKQQGVYSPTTTIQDIEGASIGDGCGSVQEFFKDYLK